MYSPPPECRRADSRSSIKGGISQLRTLWFTFQFCLTHQTRFISCFRERYHPSLSRGEIKLWPQWVFLCVEAHQFNLTHRTYIRPLFGRRCGENLSICTDHSALFIVKCACLLALTSRTQGAYSVSCFLLRFTHTNVVFSPILLTNDINLQLFFHFIV